MSKLDRRLTAAIRCHQTGDHAAAGAICKEVLAKQPSHADANHLLGVMQSQGGDQDAAVCSVTRALRARRDNPLFHNTLGNALHKSGRNAEAVASFREALRLDARYTEAWANLGLALQAMGHVDQALSAYRRALEISPRHAFAHNSIGNALIVAGDLEGALASFDTAIGCDPRYHEAHSNRGNVLKMLGRDSDALASYDAAVDIDANDVAAVNNRANLLLQQGAHASALPALEATAQQHPHDCATLVHLGVAYAGLGRFTEATACFEQVLAIDANNAAAQYYRGHVLRATGFPDAAIAHYLGAIASNPYYPEAFDGLLFTLIDTLRFDQLDTIVDGILAESRVMPAHGGGIRVIRAIGQWLRNHVEPCRVDIQAADRYASDVTRFPNDAMIGIYRRYLGLLLAYRDAHPQRYVAADAQALHVVGESHCLAAAWTSVTIDGEVRRVVPHLVMGAKAWHFASPQWNDHKHNLRRIVDDLPRSQKVVFIFGEIDTRIDDGILRHLQRHPDADLETMTLNTVSGYVEHIIAVSRAQGITPVFQGVPAPAIDYTSVSVQQREGQLYLIRFFNAALATLARQHACAFLDVYALSAGPQGIAHGNAHLDAYHLTPAYLGRALEAAATSPTPTCCELANG